MLWRCCATFSLLAVSFAWLTTVDRALADDPGMIVPSAAVDRIDVLRRANRSTVRIEAVQRNQWSTDSSSGAGVVVSDGYVLTAHHVVRDRSEIRVLTTSGDRLDATIVWFESELDLALLRVSRSSVLETASIAPATNIREGRAAVVIGNPLGAGQRVVTGRLGPTRLVHWDGKRARLRAIVAEVAPGNSGGGAYDLVTGELLGITVAKSSTLANTGYVVPADCIAQRLGENLALPALSDAKDVRTTLGVTLRPVRLIEGRFSTGLLVTDLEPDGAAEKAGWRTGDVLVGFDKYQTASVSDVAYVLRSFEHASASPIFCLFAEAFRERPGHVAIHPDEVWMAQSDRNGPHSGIR